MTTATEREPRLRLWIPRLVGSTAVAQALARIVLPYLSPALIESAECDMSSQMVQVRGLGDVRQLVTALFTLKPEAIPIHAARLGPVGKPDGMRRSYGIASGGR